MPAILNRVVETTTGAGTGNLTLDGAATSLYGPSARTFSAALAGVGLNFYYDIFHQTAAEFERGIGVLNGGALQRLLVIESSNSNALVNFSAGTKTIMSAATPDDLKLEPLNLSDTQVSRKTFFGRHGDSAIGLTAGRLYLTPFVNIKDIIVSGIGVNVTTASGTAGHVARLGLFEKAAVRTYRRVIDFGTVLVDSTGNKIISQSFDLPVGNYYIGLVAQGGTVSGGEPAFWNNWGNGGLGSNGGCWDYADSISATTAFSATYTTNLSPIVNQAVPTIHLRTSTGLFQ